MEDRELDRKVKQAFDGLTPEIFDSVLSDCRRQTGKVVSMKPRRKRNLLRRAAGIAAALLLMVGGVSAVGLWRLENTAVASVSLDVNPSVEIKVNEKEKVVSVTALNEDGQQIIAEMDFEGSSLEVTVNALIGSMLRQGYLSVSANSVLVSVESTDSQQAAALEQRLREEIGGLLESGGINGAVLSQTVAQSEELEALAAEYNITRGRAQLIQEVLRERPLHTFEELAPLSINELNLLLSDTAGAAQVEIVGTASDKGYIGEEKALTAALERAGVSADAMAYYEIGLDTERGVMVYDVEFTAGDYEYECDVNATSGEIVKFEKERADRPASVTSPSAGGALTGGSISETDAKALALARVPGATDADIVKFEQDYDDGRLIYEGKIIFDNREYEFEIDAATGAVLDWDSESVYD